MHLLCDITTTTYNNDSTRRTRAVARAYCAATGRCCEEVNASRDGIKHNTILCKSSNNSIDYNNNRHNNNIIIITVRRLRVGL